MNGRNLVLGALCVVAIACQMILGQGGDVAAGEVSRLTAQLENADWTMRSEAFYKLIQIGAKGDRLLRVGPATTALLREIPAKSDEVKAALTKTLAVENGRVKASQDLEEEFTQYYGDLISAVTSLRDPKSVAALSDAVGTGQMVIRTLGSFGESAVEPVLAKLRSEGGAARQGACIVLGILLDPANPASIKDPATRNRIKDELKKAAQDMAGAYIRTAAVEGLARLKDPEVVSFLTDIARKDGYDASQLVGKPGSFPVREAAAAALHKIGKDDSGTAGKTAMAALGKLSQEGSGSVRNIAADALRDLGGVQSNASAPALEAAGLLLRRLNLGSSKKSETKEPEAGAPSQP